MNKAELLQYLQPFTDDIEIRMHMPEADPESSYSTAKIEYHRDDNGVGFIVIV